MTGRPAKEKKIVEGFFTTCFTATGFSVTAVFFIILSSFRVFAQVPVVDFSADFTAGCKPLVVKFSGNSVNTTKWNWDLGNGTISSAKNPGTTYLKPGTYTVKLTATNANGSTEVIKTDYITVYDLPTIDFTTSDSTGCAPLATQFTDLSVSSSGNLIQWQWAFGDGDESNNQNPFHIYATAGTFNVSLTATSNRGCSNTTFKPLYIKAGGSFTADFSSTIFPYCGTPVQVSFSNLSSGVDSLNYTWDFGDGSVSTSAYPTHNYSSFGNYNVSLIGVSEEGCRDTVTKVVQIATRQVSFSGPSTLCTNTVGDFKVTSEPTPLFVTWKMGDGTTYNSPDITHTYLAPGVYQVLLINDFGGCVDSATKTVTVTNPAVADFTSTDTAACKAPFTTRFKSQVQGLVSLSWDFGDQSTSTAKNPGHTYQTPGKYNVTLQFVDSAGCVAKITKPDFVKIIEPLIHFQNLPVNGCNPYTFTPAYTIDHADSIISYAWDFGDGTTSTDPNPFHLYSNDGSYNLTLTVTTIGGCSNTLTLPAAVKVSSNTAAIFDFTATTTDTCVDRSIQFTSTATGNNLSYKWYFGDNISSGQKAPVHSYADTGYYTVRLDVSFDGCTGSVIKPLLIKVEGPIARFNFQKDCTTPGRVFFTDTSKNRKSILWEFGDGTTSTETNPVHDYADSGNYLVKLTAINRCIDSAKLTVPIWTRKTTFDASATNVCKGEIVTFTVTHPQPTWVNTYYFNFSGNLADGFISSKVATVNWAYRTAGDFKVTTIVIDKFGCRDTIVLSQPIHVHGANANFSVIQNFQCTGQLTEFADLSVAERGSINCQLGMVFWRWLNSEFYASSLLSMRMNFLDAMQWR